MQTTVRSWRLGLKGRKQTPETLEPGWSEAGLCPWARGVGVGRTAASGPVSIKSHLEQTGSETVLWAPKALFHPPEMRLCAELRRV